MEINVKCTNCNWEGVEKELKVSDNKVESCPNCESSNHLMDDELSNIRESLISDIFGF